MNRPVLIVDDETAVRNIVGRFLRAVGYDVQTAKNGGEALELLAAQNGDARLVLTDVVMPVMGGFELVRAVRERWPAVPCLYMSGFADADATAAGLEPVCPLVTKPFELGDLARQVRALAGDP